MKFFVGVLLSAVLVSIPTTTADCCGDYNVGDDCCNIFGCNCEAPCWNRGCKTECQKGKFPGRPISCPGNNNKYDCCRPGEQCIPNCKAQYIGDCCCTAGKTKLTISLSNVKYDFNKVEKESSNAMVVKIKYKGTNAGNNNQPVGKVSSSLTYTQTTSWQFSTATKISVTASVKAGIPFFADGEIKTTVEETLTYGESKTKSVSSQIAIDTGNDSIPPYSRQSYQFDAEMFLFKIPFTALAVVQDQCGTGSIETTTGIAKLDGVAQFVEGDFTKKVGPAIPVECKSPFGTPIDDQQNYDFCSTGSPECKENTLCVRYGISGTQGICCQPGNLSPCCAYAGAHPACIEVGFKENIVLCPSPKGNFHPCCTGVSKLFSFEIEQVQEMTKEQTRALAQANALVCLPNSQADTQDQMEERISAIPVIAKCELY